MIKKTFTIGKDRCSCMLVENITGTQKKLPLTEVLEKVKTYMQQENLEALKVKGDVFKTRENDICDTALFLKKSVFEKPLIEKSTMASCTTYHIINYGICLKEKSNSFTVAKKAA